jgi:hypothetical protein
MGLVTFPTRVDDVSGVVGLQFILWQFECNDFRKCSICVVAVYISIYKSRFAHTLLSQGQF